jgi:type I restriction enzyme S subunit
MMREEWVEVNYETVVKKVTLTNKKIKQKEYLNKGNIPVIDQGQELIGGYTNDETKILDCELPSLVFGDHTKIVKLINFPFASGADGTKVLEPKLHFEPKLLKYFTEILALKIKDKGYARHYQDIEKSQIPLPPPLEQKAIVAKIEQLFSELDNGIENLKMAQAKLKIYRQAVLQKAFEGEFTREWREKQTNLPTADELLETIKQEREAYYLQQLEEWKAAVKKWEKNGSIGKKPSKPRKKEEDDIFTNDNLPTGWLHCPIKNLGLVATGATPLRSNRLYWENGTVPWIKSGALNADFVKEADEFTTENALEETNIKIFPKHTLLIALYGEGKTRGMCSELLIETTTNQAISGIIQEGIEEATRPYLKHFLKKNYQDIRRKSSGGVQPNLNSDIVKNTLVPLCCLEEQTQIIQEIESRLSVCDKIEETIKQSLLKSEALRQSILKKAFEGNLLNAQELEAIHTDPDYESAEKLLKRIKQERAK